MEEGAVRGVPVRGVETTPIAAGSQIIVELNEDGTVIDLERLSESSHGNQRAYELYLARDGADGYAAEDWLQAEQELQARQP
jgi:Protein of unknown function (DUF2934)